MVRQAHVCQRRTDMRDGRIGGLVQRWLPCKAIQSSSSLLLFWFDHSPFFWCFIRIVQMVRKKTTRARTCCRSSKREVATDHAPKGGVPLISKTSRKNLIATMAKLKRRWVACQRRRRTRWSRKPIANPAKCTA